MLPQQPSIEHKGYRGMTEACKRQGKSKGLRRTVRRLLTALVILGLLSLGGLTLYGKYKIRQIPALSFHEALAYTTHNNPEALITVGIIKDGKASYKVYGENARELSPEQHRYEIGSLTKTFTAALLLRAAEEGLVKPDETLDAYLPLPDTRTYPALEALLTHTSGYKSFYFERPMIDNFFKGRNSFCGISKETVKARLARLSTGKGEAPFKYSNFGYAVLGLVLEAVYEEDAETLLNHFVQKDLGLKETRMPDSGREVKNAWDWQPGDAYMAAGALSSTIGDMLAYAELQLDDSGLFHRCHQELRTIAHTPGSYEAMGIHMDAAGMAWILDKTRQVVWHNGGTGHYNCYLGFHPESRTAVVVLSNLPPSYRIPATILGIKRLEELTGPSYGF